MKHVSNKNDFGKFKSHQEFLEKLLNSTDTDFWSAKHGIIKYLENKHPKQFATGLAAAPDLITDVIEMLACFIDSEAYEMQKDAQ